MVFSQHFRRDPRPSAELAITIGRGTSTNENEKDEEIAADVQGDGEYDKSDVEYR